MNSRFQPVKRGGPVSSPKSAFRPALIPLPALLLFFSLALSATAQTDLIEPGSVVNITAVGHPEFSQTVVVHPDGTTDYPLLGNVPIDGMNPEDLNQLLSNVLKRVIDRPLVFVTLSHYSTVEVRVVGAVQAPGDTQVRAPADIQSVLASVGGTLDKADLRRIAVVRNRATGRVIDEINLYEYAAQNPEHFKPVNLEPGDMVMVPLLERESYVRVIGAVNLPGTFIPDPRATVLDLIYQAGGPARNADLNHVRYIHGTGGPGSTLTDLDFEDLVEQGQDFPPVAPGDLIVIGFQDNWKTFSFWAGFVRDLALVASSIVILSRI